MRGSWLLRRLGRMLIRRTAAEFEAENVPGRAVLVQYQAPWPSNHRSGLRWSRQAAGGFHGGNTLRPLEGNAPLTDTSSMDETPVFITAPPETEAILRRRVSAAKC